jgi:hypothetical protein
MRQHEWPPRARSTSTVAPVEPSDYNELERVSTTTDSDSTTRLWLGAGATAGARRRATTLTLLVPFEIAQRRADRLCLETRHDT